MSNEILEKLQNMQELTNDEILFVLQDIISIVLDQLKNVPISNSKKCVEAKKLLYNVCGRFGLLYVELNTNELKDNRLYHEFGFIVFNRKTSPLRYLVDVTFDQFSKDEYEDERNKSFSPDSFLRKELRDKLVNEKYLPFTRDIFQSYINAFVLASNVSNGKDFINFMYNDKFVIFNESGDYNYNIDKINNHTI